MTDIMTYILGMVVCSGVFTVFYRTALHRHVSFRTARIYLVVSLVAAAVIPAFDIPVWKVSPIEIPVMAQTFTMPTTEIPAVAAPVDWMPIILWSLYGLGIAALAVAMIRQIARIARIKKRAEVFRTDECEIAVSGEIDTPFSFLETVFIERGTPDEELRQIMLHEASHIRHRHSQEKIAVEVLKNLMWFNPFAWWAASLLGEVHEFEADRDVLDGGATVEEYLPLIFRRTFGYNPDLSVGLGDSLTKKRFQMMKNKIKPTKYSLLRMAGVLPLAAGMMMLFGFTRRAPEIIFTTVPATVESVVETAAPAPAPVEAPVPDAAAAPVVQNPGGQDIPLITPEIPPIPPGGDINSFRLWVQERLVYPKEAHEKGISGRVIVRFVVEKDGSITTMEALLSPDRVLSDEAIRVLLESPKWTPGMDGGKPVRVWYIMPIEFVLQGDEPDNTPDTSAENVNANADPVTVVGYGTVGRSDIEVSGRSDAGVIINNTSGTEPLLFLDGNEITGEQMKALDPATIQQIDVLKDASATAIYGVRAKDGVILISTKKEGDAGDAVINPAFQNTFFWNAREKREMIDSDYTIQDGQRTVDGQVAVYWGENLETLPAEIKVAMGGKTYGNVVVFTPKQ